MLETERLRGAFFGGSVKGTCPFCRHLSTRHGIYFVKPAKLGEVQMTVSVTIGMVMCSTCRRLNGSTQAVCWTNSRKALTARKGTAI